MTVIQQITTAHSDYQVQYKLLKNKGESNKRKEFIAKVEKLISSLITPLSSLPETIEVGWGVHSDFLKRDQKLFDEFKEYEKILEREQFEVYRSNITTGQIIAILIKMIIKIGKITKKYKVNIINFEENSLYILLEIKGPLYSIRFHSFLRTECFFERVLLRIMVLMRQLEKLNF